MGAAGRGHVREGAGQAGLVQEDALDARRRDSAGQVPLGEQDASPTVAKHEGQALRGVGRVQRDVGATGLEDTQEPCHQLHGARGAHGDESTGPHAAGAKLVGEGGGTCLQLPVRQRGVTAHQGHGLGRARCLRREELGQGGLTFEGRGGVVPLPRHPALFLGGQKLQCADALAGLSHRAGQQRAQVRHHPLRGACLEQVRAVLQRAAQPVGRVRQRQREVVLRGRRLHVQRQQGQARQRHGGKRVLLKQEHHLEEGGAAQVALGPQLLHQLFEGNVLVRVRAERHLAHPAEQLAEGQLRGEVGAQHQVVDEGAHQALQLGAAAAGDGGADADVLLAGVAVKQRLEAGEQHHEGSAALAARQGLEGLGQLTRQAHRHAGTAEGLRSGARLVGGQLQGVRGARELRAPVRHLRVQHLAAQPLALPARVVGVAHGQLGQGRGAARGQRLVERRQLADEHAHGGAVGDEVVHRQRQHVGALGQPQQHHAQQRTGLQVEGMSRLREGVVAGLVFTPRLGHTAQVHHRQRHGERGGDELHGLAVSGGHRGAQRLVALDEDVEAALQHGHVQRPLQPEGGGDVVDGACGLKLLEEPQALLGEGQRRRSGVVTALQRRHAPGRQGRGPGREQLQCQLARRGPAQQRVHGEGHAQRPLRVVRQLGGAQRVQAISGDGLVRGHRLHSHARARGQPLPQPVLNRLGGVQRSFARGLGRFGRGSGGHCFAPRQHFPQLAREPGRARALTLNLPARCLGNAAGLDEHQRVQLHLVQLRQPLAHRREHFLHGGQLPARVHLLHQHQALLALHLHAEGRATTGAQRRVGLLRRQLQVLRVVVAAAKDEQVLETAGDEELVPAQEAQVPGAKEGPVAVGRPRIEGTRRLFRTLPVALRHAGATHPDFTHLARLARAQRLGLDDEDLLALHRLSAPHQHASILRVGLGGLHAVAAQGLRLHRVLRGARALLHAGDNQRAFGQAVAGVEGLTPESARAEGLDEALQRLGTDGLRAAEGQLPAAQVQLLALLRGNLPRAQLEGEVGSAADGAAET